MNRNTPTYSSRYTRQDMAALYGTRPATSTMQTVQCPEGYIPYTIRSGDTLQAIADARNITVTELLFYNPDLNPYGYRAGDVLCVPGSSGGTSSGSGSMNGNGTSDDSTNGNGSSDSSMNGNDMSNDSMDENQSPAQPGEGESGLPTPSLPSEGETPAQPGEGPGGLPTPSLPSTPSLPPAPACEDGMLYTVRAGDTLRAIAQRFDVTLDALLSANPGNTNNRLVIGQRLCIPQTTCQACCPEGSSIVRIRSTNFVDYLINYNISYAALSAANPSVDLENLKMGRQLCIPPVGSRGSCAQDAGTLELPRDITAAMLAEDLGVTVADLMRYNPTYTPTDFIAGRIICVPPTENE